MYYQKIRQWLFVFLVCIISWVRQEKIHHFWGECVDGKKSLYLNKIPKKGLCIFRCIVSIFYGGWGVIRHEDINLWMGVFKASSGKLLEMVSLNILWDKYLTLGMYEKPLLCSTPVNQSSTEISHATFVHIKKKVLNAF